MAEWKAEWEEAEAVWETKKLARSQQQPQPTLADVMELLQKLMLEVMQLQAKVG